jgi:hypothetical protein
MSPFIRFDPVKFLCACCSRFSTIISSQKRAHIIHCQRCPLKPFICSNCRLSKGKKNLTNTCVWCQTPGTLHSMHSLSCVEMNVREADSLHFLREQTTSLEKLPYLKRVILTNWCRFVESKQIVSCTFLTYSSYVKDLKVNFMHTWLNYQLSQNVTSRNFRALFFHTKISKQFLHILKTITFARILVSNLFQVQSNLRLFSQKMRRLVFRHLLSNFANLSFC